MGEDESGMRWGVGKRKVVMAVREEIGTDTWVGKNKMRQEVGG